MRIATNLHSAWLYGCALLLGGSVAISHAAVEDVDCAGTAARIYAEVDLIRSELDLIRKEMGKPYPDTLHLEVIGAKTREIYYQSNTLLRKARQLETESTFKLGTPTNPLPIPRIDADAILGELDETLLHVRNVKRELAIPEELARKEFNTDISCNAVFHSVVQANREINELLYGHFSPNEVYLELEVAMKYTAVLRSKYPAPETIPEPYPFERGKRPMDVYGALLKVYDLVRRTVAHLGFGAPDFRVRALDEKTVTPSDVYDLGKLIVSELALLSYASGIEESFEEVEYPDVNKLPAHVYQLAKKLESQIGELAEQVARNPERLTLD